MRQGFGVRALHKVGPGCVYLTWGALWARVCCTGRALGTCALHKEGFGHLLSVQRSLC